MKQITLVNSRDMRFGSIGLVTNGVRDGRYYYDKYQELLTTANADPYFYGIPLNPETERTLLCSDDDVVGFFEIGMQNWFEGTAYYRANRPYTAPAYRGHGYMHDALKQWFKDRKPAMAWIDDNNISSIRLYQGLGFVKTKALVHKEKNGHVYILPRDS